MSINVNIENCHDKNGKFNYEMFLFELQEAHKRREEFLSENKMQCAIIEMLEDHEENNAILKTGDIFPAKIRNINDLLIELHKKMNNNPYDCFLINKNKVKILEIKNYKEIEDCYDLIVNVLCDLPEYGIKKGDMFSAEILSHNTNNILLYNRLLDDKIFYVIIEKDKVEIIKNEITEIIFNERSSPIDSIQININKISPYYYIEPGELEASYSDIYNWLINSIKNKLSPDQPIFKIKIMLESIKHRDMEYNSIQNKKQFKRERSTFKHFILRIFGLINKIDTIEKSDTEKHYWENFIKKEIIKTIK